MVINPEDQPTDTPDVEDVGAVKDEPPVEEEATLPVEEAVPTVEEDNDISLDRVREEFRNAGERLRAAGTEPFIETGKDFIRRAFSGLRKMLDDVEGKG